MSARLRLEKVVNVAIIIAVGFFIAAQVRLFVAARPPALPTSHQTYNVGDTLPALPGLRLAAGERTLLVFVSRGCHFCDESMGFYARVLAARDRAHSRVRMIAVSRDPAARLTEHLAQYPMTLDAVLSVPQDVAPGLHLTPTVLLVSEGSKILNVWVGKQNETGERSVFSALALDGVGRPGAVP